MPARFLIPSIFWPFGWWNLGQLQTKRWKHMEDMGNSGKKMEIHKDMSSQDGKSNLIYYCIQVPIPRIYDFPPFRLKKAVWNKTHTKLIFVVIGSTAQKAIQTRVNIINNINNIDIINLQDITYSQHDFSRTILKIHSNLNFWKYSKIYIIT